MTTASTSDAELVRQLDSLAKYFGPLQVPEPGELPRVQELCSVSDPFRADAAADELFVVAMREINAWHALRNPLFGALWKEAGAPDPDSVEQVAELPYIHVNLFKRHALSSIEDDAVALRLTSSGTGGEKTEIGFDAWSIGAAQRMDAWTVKALGLIDVERPANYLVLGLVVAGVVRPRAQLHLGALGVRLDGVRPVAD
ncbi:hypothetical protein AB0H10_39710, partial [Streptomyces longwoodensis]